MSILRRISVIALCVALCIFQPVDSTGNCALQKEDGSTVSTTEWSFGITLDNILDTQENGTTLLNFTSSNIADISSIVPDSTSGLTFMDATLDNGQLIISLTDNFINYEEYETSTMMKITIAFVCSVDTRSIEIYQPVIDTNNHYPEFQDAPYSYFLPMPFPSNLPLHLFEIISARDIDLTNTNISFALNSSDPNADGFTASWLSQDDTDTKLHYASLITTVLLNLASNVTFSIYATDAGTPPLTSETSITIFVNETNSVPVAPQFSFPIYIANYSHLALEEADGTLIIFDQGNITLSQGADSAVIFNLTSHTGDYASHFELTSSNDYATLYLNLRNPTEELLLEPFVILTLFARRTGAFGTGLTILHISLPSSPCSNSPATTDAPTSQESTETSVTSDQINTTSTTDTIDYSSTNDVIVSTTWITDDTSSSESDVPDSSTVSTVSTDSSSCPACTCNTECPTTVTLVTESPTASSTDCICDYSTITGSSDFTDSSDSTVPIVSTVTTFPSTDSTETTHCPVITVTEECICEDTSTTSTTTTTSTTSSTDAESDSTTLSDTDLESTSTTSSTEEQTEASTITTVASPTISFSKGLYRFEESATFTGTLMIETATVTNGDGTVIYSTVINEEYLNERIFIDSNTAELRVTATVSPGIYTFDIVATLEEWNLSTRSTVLLIISSVTECNGEEVFGYALQVIELEEESPHSNLVPLDDNDCNYTIYSQSPDQDWFYLESATLNAREIDRESSYFEDIHVAQVRIVIDMSCPNDSSEVTHADSARRKRDTEYEVITSSIPYVRTRMVVTAIITDINDNAPIWHSDTPSVIGHPGYRLSQLVRAPYVYKFSATDPDLGENATITYSLKNDATFYIHSSEGTMYIQRSAYVEDAAEVMLFASDPDHTTPFPITIRSLESYHVAVYYFENAVLEDLSDIVEEIIEKAGYWIGTIDAAVVSDMDVTNSTIIGPKISSDSNTLLRVLVYGLQSGEPVRSATLVELAGDLLLSWKLLEKDTLDNVLLQSTCDTNNQDFSTLGFWIVIGLQFLLIVVLFMIIILCYSRRRSKSAVAALESVIPGRNDETCNDIYKKSSATPARNSRLLLNDAHNLNNNSSSTEGRRKSVAFKETVDEIEVARL